MEKIDKNRRYKWSNSATNLLVSVWSHDIMQNRLKLSSRNLPIWEGIARYMGKNGFNVTGLQCRTRIKNMLSNYYEALRKKDRSLIEPYYDLFEKVLSNRNQKKKGTKGKNSKQIMHFEEVDDGDDNLEAASSESSVDIEQFVNKKTEHNSSMEYLHVNSQEVQVSMPVADRDIISSLEQIITKAIDTQTKAISESVKIQTEIIEKLLLLEREKLEAILLAEKESRKQLEERIDKLLAKLESNTVSQITYVGPLIET